MADSRKIAFLSYYGYQRRFFTFLADNMANRAKAILLNVYSISFSPQFMGKFIYNMIFRGKRLNEALISEIILFTNRKFKVRHPECNGLWLRLIEQIQRVKALAYYQFFETYFKKNTVNLLVVWNGLPLPVAAAVAAAKRASVKLLFCENGYLPKTVVMDPSGVNAFNSLMGKTADFYRQVKMDADKLKCIFETTLIPRQIKTRHQEKLKEMEIDLPDQYIFLPLQVHDDSQILIHSPRFKDMISLVEFCADAVSQLNRKQKTNYKLVVKEHPSDYRRIDYSQLRTKYQDVLFANFNNTAELIKNSIAVITVNSTVGIESLLYYKPVVTLGNAFYNIPGVVYPLGKAENLSDVLATVAANPSVDKELINGFLYYLRYEYLVAIDRKNLEKTDPEEAVERILKAVNA